MTTRELPPVPFDEYNVWKDKDRLTTLIMRRAWSGFNTREEALAQAAEDGGGGVIFDMVSSPRYNYAGGASIGWTYVPQNAWEQMPAHMVASMPHANPRSGSSGKHKYNVTVLVDAGSESEAKRMVEGAGQANPKDHTQDFWGRDAYAMGIKKAQDGDYLPDAQYITYHAKKHFQSPGMIQFWNNSTDNERKNALKEFKAAYTAGFKAGSR